MDSMNDFFNIDDQWGYPDAGKNAPSGVRQAIEKYRSLPKETRLQKPLLYFLLGSGTPPYKMSKEDSKYTTNPVKGQKCSNCRFAYQRVTSKEFICSQIRGNIQPDHWCRLWVIGTKEK